jgi:hypothetical protein
MPFFLVVIFFLFFQLTRSFQQSRIILPKSVLLRKAIGVQKMAAKLTTSSEELVDVVSNPTAPDWFQELKTIQGSQRLNVAEWDNEKWRKEEGGFSGYDFCHSIFSAVRILEYVLLPSQHINRDLSPSSHHHNHDRKEFPLLVGAVYFTPRAESHRGLCHGGTMCA